MADDVVVAAGKKTLTLFRALEKGLFDMVHQIRLQAYLRSDRRPWRAGYTEFKHQYLEKVLNDDALLEIFRENRPLPARYGFRLDARTIEIPWVLSRLNPASGFFLDAGSSLNFNYVLKAPRLAGKKISILTLAPETRCYWDLGISYFYGDLRNMILRDNGFDEIACISTIEHVGMDNTQYARQDRAAQRSSSTEYLWAVKELRRVLKPEGTLFLTFPFGRYEDHGWFQQFDSEMVDALIEAFGPSRCQEVFFRYEPEGWKQSTRSDCAGSQFFDVRASKYYDSTSVVEYPPDYAAGERAVACLQLQK